MKLKLPFILLFLFFSFDARAAAAGKTPWYLAHVESVFGYGSSASPVDSVSPVVGSFGLNLNFGLRYRFFGLGLSFSETIVTQFSSVENSVGNRRGQVSSMGNPLVQFSWRSVDLRYVSVISSDYKLTNEGLAGEKIVFSKPNGYKLVLAINFPSKNKKFEKLDALIWTSNISYSESKSAGVLDSKIELNQSGIGLAYGI